MLEEIDMSIAKLQISRIGFTLKTLTPVFRTIKLRLENEEFYKLNYSDIKQLKIRELKR